MVSDKLLRVKAVERVIRRKLAKIKNKKLRRKHVDIFSCINEELRGCLRRSFLTILTIFIWNG